MLSLIKCHLILLLLQSVFLYNRETPYSLNNCGSLKNLHDHKVYCNPGEALQGFHFIRKQGTDEFKFDYTCSHNTNILMESYSDTTQWDDTSGDDCNTSNFLDRHRIHCKDEFALSGFQLFYENSKIQYRYECTRIISTECEEASNTWTDGSNGGSIFLDRQEVNVKRNQFLTGFRLNVHYRQGGGFNLSYSYNFCIAEEDLIFLKK
jgi:hypothetical protein